MGGYVRREDDSSGDQKHQQVHADQGGSRGIPLDQKGIHCKQSVISKRAFEVSCQRVLTLRVSFFCDRLMQKA